MARTPSLLRPQIEGMIDALTTTVVPSLGVPFPWPIGGWIRPRGADVDPLAHLRYEDPPFVNVRIFPSAGDFDGPINDTQADTHLRVQVQSVGLSDIQAVQVLDLTREVYANRNNVTVPGRYVQNLKLMIVSGGVSRDNDILTPVYYDFDVYELWTTPE